MVIDRGQAHTLEAISAALLLIAGFTFALQITAVTPLTASTSSQHIENQQSQVAKGLLDAAAENGSLRNATLFWNNASGRFQGSNERGYYTTSGPPGTVFSAMLNRTFVDRGIAVNVNVWYVADAATGTLRKEPLVKSGVPSDQAITVRRTVTLHDDDRLTGRNNTTLGATSSFYAPDITDQGGVYNVIQVEVVVWRI